jgi:hypothetical protein
MIIINTAICFNNLSVKELMEKVNEMIDLKISRSTFNRRLVGKSLILRVIKISLLKF